ncbi:MAG: PD-(D/E)XK nuclease family protein, partial [Clostridia bacterium]|nr:PD-(D/E)XK nuclease family protein [Clostridia bacterium]
REEDLSGAVVFDDDTDAVRIMSIHKSKGLEFPVVFVSRCGTGFNTSDSKGHLLLDKELGFGPDYINYESSLYVNTAAKKAIELKIQKESVAEEMRKLYVALTRAKEKLYVTAVCGGEVSEAKDVGKWRKSVVEGRMPAYIGGEVNKFIDWVAPMAMMDQDNWNFSVTQYKDCFFDEVDVTNSQYNAELIEITDDKYKYENSLNVGVKVSVSEINAQHTGNSRLLPPKAPQFLSDEEAGGAMRGTAVHYVMQKFIPDSNVTPDKIQGFIDRLYHDEELSEAEYNAVNACEIYDFYNSEIGKRILKSPKVLREVPFEIEIPASEIYDGASDEPIMLQGIIDCCFYEDGQVVIVDYKTDKNSDIIKIKQKYSLQLEYYSRAIEKILKIHVKNKYIYLFLSKNVIKC